MQKGGACKSGETSFSVSAFNNISKKFIGCGKDKEEAKDNANKQRMDYAQEKQKTSLSSGPKFKHQISGETGVSAYNGKRFKGTVNGKTAKQRAKEYNMEKSKISEETYNSVFANPTSKYDIHLNRTRVGHIRNSAAKMHEVKEHRERNNLVLGKTNSSKSYKFHPETLRNSVRDAGIRYANAANLSYKTGRALNSRTDYEEEKLREMKLLHGMNITRRSRTKKQVEDEKKAMNKAKLNAEKAEVDLHTKAKEDLLWTMENNRKLLNQERSNEAPWQRELRLKKEKKANFEKVKVQEEQERLLAELPSNRNERERWSKRKSSSRSKSASSSTMDPEEDLDENDPDEQYTSQYKRPW